MNPVIDARGLACPQPVVMTAKALADADRVTTIVDNAAAVENVTRLARSRGFVVSVQPRADGTWMELTRDGAAPRAPATEPLDPIACRPATQGPTVLLVTSDVLGQGADALGERLMAAFFHTLPEITPLPATVVLMNAGVRLAIEGARTVDDLRTLSERGVDVMACGTCLGYFDVTERLAAGRITNMYDIAQVLLEAGKVVHV